MPKGVKDVKDVLRHSGVSGQEAQPAPLTSLKLSMAVYGQKLDWRRSR